MNRCFNRIVGVLGVVLLAGVGSAKQVVEVDLKSEGRVYEGVGLLSAGASSRLLKDYPEPVRSQILDFLFKPKFGASINHLKVEIGGDINSTDGSEPSHARTRDELENPKEEYYQRGYEWWLMNEAKKRNPEIILDILQWGAPGWMGDAGMEFREKFFSQDNANVICAFIKGAKEYHDLTIDYCGIWNERTHDCEWIKLLRNTLDAQKLQHVKVIAADHNKSASGGKIWSIVDDVIADPELIEAVHGIGVHYPERYANYISTPEAQSCGKSLWNSEGGPWKGDWKKGFPYLAKLYNRCYIDGKMTKVITWSLITSYYDMFRIPNSGIMMANQPWSGHYEVQPATWVLAHYTQFAEPGWRYLDSACGYLEAEGSFVTLVSPENNDYSIMIETVDAKDSQQVSFKVPHSLSGKKLAVWRTVREKETFIQQPKKIVPVDGMFTLDLVPGALYTVSSTTGQQKGTPPTEIPASQPFPNPYTEDFESYPLRATPKYLSDQEGTFEVVKNPVGAGHCLMQVLQQKGIRWDVQEHPLTYAGDKNWKNYTVSADLMIPETGFSVLVGRVSRHTNSGAGGVPFFLNSDGSWVLKDQVATKKEKTLSESTELLTGKLEPSSKKWIAVKLSFKDSTVTVTINGKNAGKAECRNLSGMVGLGSGYHDALFDNLSVKLCE